MALPVYGNPLSLSQIQGEFGGSNPISLSEYYAGGSYVPAGTVGYPSGGGAVAIPTGGTISINNFFGSQRALEVITMVVGNYQDSVYGYDVYLSLGSITPTTLVFLNNQTLTVLFWGYNQLTLTTDGPATSGAFTTLVVNGTSFSSASSNFSTDGSTFSEWYWTPVGNPIGTSGTIQCAFL